MINKEGISWASLVITDAMTFTIGHTHCFVLRTTLQSIFLPPDTYMM